MKAMKKYRICLSFFIIWLFMALPFASAQPDEAGPPAAPAVPAVSDELQIQTMLPELYLIGPAIFDEEGDNAFYQTALGELVLLDDLEDLFPPLESQTLDQLIQEMLEAGETPNLENVDEEKLCVVPVDSQGQSLLVPSGGELIGQETGQDAKKRGYEVYFAGQTRTDSYEEGFLPGKGSARVEEGKDKSKIIVDSLSTKIAVAQVAFGQAGPFLGEKSPDGFQGMSDAFDVLKNVQKDHLEQSSNLFNPLLQAALDINGQHGGDWAFLISGLLMTPEGSAFREHQGKLNLLDGENQRLNSEKEILERNIKDLESQISQSKGTEQEKKLQEQLSKQLQELEGNEIKTKENKDARDKEKQRFEKEVVNPAGQDFNAGAAAIAFLNELIQGKSEDEEEAKKADPNKFRSGFGKFLEGLKNHPDLKNHPHLRSGSDFLHYFVFNTFLGKMKENMGKIEEYAQQLQGSLDAFKNFFNENQDKLGEKAKNELSGIISGADGKLDELNQDLQKLNSQHQEVKNKLEDAAEGGLSKREIQNLQKELAELQEKINDALRKAGEISFEILKAFAKMSQEMFDDWWDSLKCSPGAPCGLPEGPDPCPDPCPEDVYAQKDMDKKECSGAAKVPKCPEFPKIEEPAPDESDKPQPPAPGLKAIASAAGQDSQASRGNLQEAADLDHKVGAVFKQLGEKNNVQQKRTSGKITYNSQEVKVQLFDDDKKILLIVPDHEDKPLVFPYNKKLFELLTTNPELVLPQLKKAFKAYGFDQELKATNEAVTHSDEQGNKYIPTVYGLVQAGQEEEIKELIRKEREQKKAVKAKAEEHDYKVNEFNQLLDKIAETPKIEEKVSLAQQALALKKEIDTARASFDVEIEKLNALGKEIENLFVALSPEAKEEFAPVIPEMPRLNIPLDSGLQNQVIENQADLFVAKINFVINQAQNAQEFNLFCPSGSEGGPAPAQPLQNKMTGASVAAQGDELLPEPDTDEDSAGSTDTESELGPVCLDPEAEKIIQSAIAKKLLALLSLYHVELLEKTKGLSPEDPLYFKLFDEYNSKMINAFKELPISPENMPEISSLENKIAEQKNEVEKSRKVLLEQYLLVIEKMQFAKAKYLEEIRLGNEAIKALRELEFRIGKIDILFSQIEAADLPPELKRSLEQAASTGYNEAVRTRDEQIKAFQEENKKSALKLNSELKLHFGFFKDNKFKTAYQKAFEDLKKLYAEYSPAFANDPGVNDILDDALKKDFEKLLKNSEISGLFGADGQVQTEQGLFRLMGELMNTLDFDKFPSLSELGALNLPSEYNAEGKINKMVHFSELLWDDLSKAIFKRTINQIQVNFQTSRLDSAEKFWKEYEQLSQISKRLFSESLDLSRQEQKAAKENDYRKLHDLSFKLEQNKREIDAFVKKIIGMVELSDLDDLRISALLSLANLMDDTLFSEQLDNLEWETKDLIKAKAGLDPEKEAEQLKKLNQIIEVNLREIRTFKKDIAGKHLAAENHKRINELIRVMERAAQFEEEKSWIDFINLYKKLYSEPKLEKAFQNSQEIAEKLYFGFLVFQRIIEQGLKVTLPDGTVEVRHDFSIFPFPNEKIGADGSATAWVIKNFGQETYDQLKFNPIKQDAYPDFLGLEATKYNGEEARLEAFRFFWDTFGRLYAKKGLGMDQPNDWAQSYAGLGMLQYEKGDYIGSASSFYTASVLAEGELKSRFLLLGEGMEATRVRQRSVFMVGEIYLDPTILIGAGLVSGLAKTGLNGAGTVIKFINRAARLKSLGRIGSGLDKAADWFRLLGQEGRVGLKDVLGKRYSLVTWLTHDFEKVIRLHFDEKTGKTIAYSVKEEALAQKIKALVQARSAARQAKVVVSAELTALAKEAGKTPSEIRQLGKKSLDDLVKVGLSEDLAKKIKNVLKIQDEIKTQESFLVSAKELPEEAKGLAEAVKKQFGFDETPKAIIDSHAKLGEGAENLVFKGKIKGHDDVAVVVVKNPIGKQTPEQVIAKLAQKSANEDLLADMRISLNGESRPFAPKVFGLVDTGGNPGYARELIKGVRPADPQAAELITQNTYQQFKAIYEKLLAEGFVMDDFQFFIASEDQVINSFQFKKGDVIVFDAGELFRIDQRAAQLSERFQRAFTSNDVKERFRISMEQLRSQLAGALGIEDEPLKLPKERINLPFAEPIGAQQKWYLRNILGENNYRLLEETGRLEDVAGMLAKGGPIYLRAEDITGWAEIIEKHGLARVIAPETAAEVAWAGAGGIYRGSGVSETGRLFAAKISTLEPKSQEYAKRIVAAYTRRQIDLNSADIQQSISKLNENDVGLFFDDLFQVQLDAPSLIDIEGTLFDRFRKSFIRGISGEVLPKEIQNFDQAFDGLRKLMVSHYKSRLPNIEIENYKKMLFNAEEALKKASLGSAEYKMAQDNLLETQLEYAKFLLQQKKNADQSLFKGLARHEDVVKRIGEIDQELSSLLNKNPELRKTVEDLQGIRIIPSGDMAVDAAEGLLWPSLYTPETTVQKIREMDIKSLKDLIVGGQTKLLASIQYLEMTKPGFIDSLGSFLSQDVLNMIKDLQIDTDFLYNPAFYNSATYLDFPPSVRKMLELRKLSPAEKATLEKIFGLNKVARGYASPTWALEHLLVGKVAPKVEHSSYFGVLAMGRGDIFAGPHGATYIIIDLKTAKAEGANLALKTPFKYMETVLVPNQEIAEGMKTALAQAEKMGLLDEAARAASLSIDDYLKASLSKIKTYDEYWKEAGMTSNPYYPQAHQIAEPQFKALLEDPNFYRLLEDTPIKTHSKEAYMSSLVELRAKVKSLMESKGLALADEARLLSNLNELMLSKISGGKFSKLFEIKPALGPPLELYASKFESDAEKFFNGFVDDVLNHPDKLLEGITNPQARELRKANVEKVRTLLKGKEPKVTVSKPGEASVVFDGQIEYLSNQERAFIFKAGDDDVGLWKIQFDKDTTNIKLELIKVKEEYQGVGLGKNIWDISDRILKANFKDFTVYGNIKNVITLRGWIETYGGIVFREYNTPRHLPGIVTLYPGNIINKGIEMKGWVSPLDHGDDMVKLMIESRYSKEAAIITLEKAKFSPEQIFKLTDGTTFAETSPGLASDLGLYAPKYSEWMAKNSLPTGGFSADILENQAAQT